KEYADFVNVDTIKGEKYLEEKFNLTTEITKYFLEVKKRRPSDIPYNPNPKTLENSLREIKIINYDPDGRKHTTQQHSKLRAVVLIVYANSESENHYIGEVYYSIANFFELAENYILLPFEWRDEVKPEDLYEVDYGKIKKKAETILEILEKLAI
ncbi:8817_t:CDS:2, partial [Dentiscutata erythropus]